MPYRNCNNTDKRNNLFLILFSVVLIVFGGAFLSPLRWPWGMILFLGLVIMMLILLVNWQVSKVGYRCSACNHEFDINMRNAFLTPHVWGKKYLKCPECQKSQWAIEIVKIR